MNHNLDINKIIIQAKRKACNDAFLEIKRLLPKEINENELNKQIINFVKQIDYSDIANNKKLTLFFIGNKVYSDTLNKIKKFLRRYNV